MTEHTRETELGLALDDDCLVAAGHRFRLTDACARVVRRLLEEPNAMVGIGDGLGAEGASREVLDELNAVNAHLERVAPGRWFIAQLPGHAVMLVARPDSAPRTGGASRPWAQAQELPDLPSTFVGREELVRKLEVELQQRGLVSVVGPGGIGKTTLAVAVAHRLAPGLHDGVAFLDLARLSSGELLVAELCTALGIDVAHDHMRDALRDFLSDRRMLIVLDCCETVIDAAAELVEDIRAGAPQVPVLVTSREPLQADGEWVHRLQPLTSPPDEHAFPVWLAMTYPAVQLFCRIAEARHAKVLMSQENLQFVGAICRRLEGSPLAIALAASHADRLGVKGVADQVGLRMLTLPSLAGAPGRHQTLEAVLDWSYQLLADDERRAFRSLACFRGSFDLDAAIAMVEPDKPTASAMVLDFVAKSLVMARQVGDVMQYRLPDMTREFAAGKLQAAGDAEYRAARQRHGRHLIRLLTAAEQRWTSMASTDWRRTYGVWVEDVRYALTWSFSDAGDALVGVELTTAAFSLAEQTALFADYRRFATRALQELPGLRPERPDLAVRLHTAPLISELRAIMDDPRQIAALTEAIEIGKAAGRADAQLGTLLAAWARHFQIADYGRALPWCSTMQKLADTHADEYADLTARRTRAQALHFLGDHAAARVLALAIQQQTNTRIPLSYTPSPVSTDVSTRILLARIHWMEGHADQAWQTVEECLALAEHETAQSVCQALGVAAIPVALWSGRYDACHTWIAELAERSVRFNYLYWQTWAGLFMALLDNIGQPLPAKALDTMRPLQQTKFRDHVGTFDPVNLAEDALVRVDAGVVGWCAAEVFRIHAEREMQAGALESAAVYLGRALETARAQGALAWELRAAMTAARLSRLMGDAAHGQALLEAVYGRFTEGFATRDLRAARQLLGRPA